MFAGPQCDATVCGALTPGCQHGARCVTGQDGDALCLCPLGYAGPICADGGYQVEILPLTLYSIMAFAPVWGTHAWGINKHAYLML